VPPAAVGTVAFVKRDQHRRGARPLPGKVIAFIPDETGKALLHNERVSQ